MNKKLVVVAIAGVLGAPLAQAQTANVTLYGRLNVDMEVVNGKQAYIQGTANVPCNQTTPVPPGSNQSCANPNQFRVSSNASRFGIRGTEALGGGLSAIFQIEQNIPGDGGNQAAVPARSIPTTSTPAGLATRETFVGLQGGWGTFKMGRFLSPYDDVHPIFGNVPTLTTTILATNSLWGQSIVGQPESGGFDDRIRNSIRYDSPSLAGFTAEVQYGNSERLGLGGNNSVSSNAGVWSFGGFYNNGPIQAGAVYEQHNQVRGAGITDQGFTVAGGYQFTNFRLAAVYQKLSYDVLPLTGVTTNTTQIKQDLWGVTGTINVGPGQVYVAYQQAMDGKGSAPNHTTTSPTSAAPRVAQVTAGPNTGAQQYEISYTYPLSKRTLLYAGYVRIKNDSNAAYSFGYSICTGNGNACGSSGSPQGFLMGMVHFF